MNASTSAPARPPMTIHQLPVALSTEATRSIGVPQPTQAVLLDALGTRITFDPPAPRLRAALRERHGVDVSEEAARAAMKAEITYYRAHLHEGRDAASLDALRQRCAAVMEPALGLNP